jgi:predicted SnoaL-like aldol condensation-catalyzing enzyme
MKMRAAERFWAEDYIQRSAHIPPGREGLFEFVKGAPVELAHELELIMAQGDMVLLRGRFTGVGQPAAWIAVDTVRMEDGLLKEHWEVIEDEFLVRTRSAACRCSATHFPKTAEGRAPADERDKLACCSKAEAHPPVAQNAGVPSHQQTARHRSRHQQPASRLVRPARVAGRPRFHLRPSISSAPKSSPECAGKVAHDDCPCHDRPRSAFH